MGPDVWGFSVGCLVPAVLVGQGPIIGKSGALERWGAPTSSKRRTRGWHVEGELVIPGAARERYEPWSARVVAVRADGVGAELAIHGRDLRMSLDSAMGHDRRLWRYDCCI